MLNATGLRPGPAMFVRDSSRRIMTMTASFGSIREYLSDQSSVSRLDCCLVCSIEKNITEANEEERPEQNGGCGGRGSDRAHTEPESFSGIDGSLHI